MIWVDVIFIFVLDVILIILFLVSFLFCNLFFIKCVLKIFKKIWEVLFVFGVNNESLIYNILL